MPERPIANLRTVRLTPGDTEIARRLFSLMAEVFEERSEPLGDRYLERLLNRPEFWAMAALVDDQLVGGVTAHAIPMTTSESSELFIYDIAVRVEAQRQGIGRALMTALRVAATADGIGDVFVPADNEDTHALDFYRGLGGAPTPVTFFTFAGDPE
jgi:aminoglycoside 3-N-acetyltransferase I